jgi:hypothetical protein
MKRLFVLVLAVVAFGATGCGGSCKDACEAALGCATQLGFTTGVPTQQQCEDTCDAVDCDNKSDVLDCVENDLVCTVDGFESSVTACFLKGPTCALILG